LNRNYILRSMQVIKEDIERAYRNANMKPLKHSAYLRLQALKERFWHADDKLACLLSLTVKDVTDFIPQLFNQVISTLTIYLFSVPIIILGVGFLSRSPCFSNFYLVMYCWEFADIY